MASKQLEFKFLIPNQCPQCDGWCGWWVDVIYLFQGKFKEWNWCSICKGRGSVVNPEGAIYG